MIHDLGIEIASAEDISEIGCRLFGFFVLAEPQARLHLTADAPGCRDNALAVLTQQLAIHPGLEVEALNGGQRRQPEEVVHALVVLGQERHVGVRPRTADVVLVLVVLAPADPGLLTPRRTGRDVCLGSDDRLDAPRRCLLPELVGAEHVAVVGYSHGGHLLRGRGLHEGLDPGRSIQHRILAVHMKVHEGIAGCHWFSSLARGVSSTISPARHGEKLTRQSRGSSWLEAPQVRVEGRPDTDSGTRRVASLRGVRTPAAWRGATGG